VDGLPRTDRDVSEPGDRGTITANLIVDNLTTCAPPTEHDITLSVTDVLGRTATTTIFLFVGPICVH
jgi:hypothetical protein